MNTKIGINRGPGDGKYIRDNHTGRFLKRADDGKNVRHYRDWQHVFDTRHERQI